MLTRQFHLRKHFYLLFFFILSSVFAFSQTKITGKILSADNQPVPFATISIKGTNTQVSSNESGSFTIDAKSTDVLIISNVGYSTMEVSAENASIVKLAQTTNDLNEVVVTALGIRKEKRNWVMLSRSKRR